MKKMFLTLLAATLGLAAAPASARTIPLLLFPHNPQLAGLFDPKDAFTAGVQWQSRQGTNTITVRYQVAFAPGKSRAEVDWTHSSAALSPDEAAQVKSSGMDRAVTLWRLDQKKRYTIFPNRKQYLEDDLTDEQMKQSNTTLSVKETELGKEKVDVHSCLKMKAAVTDTLGQQHELILWRAKDLKKFPIKMEEVDTSRTLTLLFEDVKHAKPVAGLFELPAGYEKINGWPDISQPFPPPKPEAPGQTNPPAPH